MNPKIFLVGIVAALVIVLGVIAISGQTLIGDLADRGFGAGQTAPAEILPVELELDGITVLSVDERSATLQIAFVAINPNEKSVLLHFLSYRVYEGDLRIHAGEIGERLESLVVGSNYVTLLSNQPVTLRDTFTLRNTGNTPDLWEGLSADTVEWRVTGDVVYALSSVTAGGQNEIMFEFP